MPPTSFAPILSDLLQRIPGAIAAALVDLGGETVDYGGNYPSFEVKVAAAHMRIILNDLACFGRLGPPRWLVLRGARKTFLARQLPDDYALVAVLGRRAGFAPFERALAVCERAIRAEAGWPQSDSSTWFPISVEEGLRGRPRFAGTARAPLEVIGAIVGLRRGERGFLVRAPDGNELTLVREPGNTWYADQDLGAFLLEKTQVRTPRQS